MATLTNHGLAVDVPRGWEAEIYQRAPAIGEAELSLDDAPLRYPPILHLATFALPPTRGDFGGGALGVMAPTDVFLTVLDYGADAASTAMFAHDPPWPLGAEDFDPHSVRVGIADQTGCQRFFRAAGRGFCLYVVLGSHTLRAVTVPRVNAALASLRFA